MDAVIYAALLLWGDEHAHRTLALHPSFSLLSGKPGAPGALLDVAQLSRVGSTLSALSADSAAAIADWLDGLRLTPPVRGQPALAAPLCHELSSLLLWAEHSVATSTKPMAFLVPPPGIAATPAQLQVAVDALQARLALILILI